MRRTSVLVIVGVILIAAGVWLYTANSRAPWLTSLNSWFAAPTSTPPSSNGNASSTTSTTTPALKTYSDPQLGFEFQYPTNIIVNDIPYNPGAPLPPPDKRIRLADIYFGCEIDPTGNKCLTLRENNIDFLVLKSATTTFDASNYYAKDMKFTVASREDIVIGGGIPAVREIDKITYPVVGTSTRQDVHVSFYREGKLFSFNYSLEDSEDNVVQTFLSTFKWTK